jgi:hypothetical protein
MHTCACTSLYIAISRLCLSPECLDSHVQIPLSFRVYFQKTTASLDSQVYPQVDSFVEEEGPTQVNLLLELR